MPFVSTTLKPRRLVWLSTAMLLGSFVALTACAQLKSPPKTDDWGYKIVAAYPHDVTAFTQGLIVFEGQMYEATGGLGTSTLRRVDWKTGESEELTRLHRQYFGEGIAILGERLFQLTWQNRIGLVYDVRTLKWLKNFAYTGEGWGLTSDDKHLIMSDGTSTLRFLDPETFKVVKRLTVKAGSKKIGLLNELEYVDGEIWSNIWHDDRIVRISPVDGRVLGWINLAGLYARSPQEKEHVLNGIAFDSKARRLFVTGKNWPQLFEIEIVRP